MVSELQGQQLGWGWGVRDMTGYTGVLAFHELPSKPPTADS